MSALDTMVSHINNSCFEIKFMNTTVVEINYEIGNCIIYDECLLPMDLKLTENEDVKSLIQNIRNFDSWCAKRTLSITKTNAKKIYNFLGISQDSSDKTKAKLALTYRCLSLDDAYWVCKKSENLQWENVDLHLNKSTNILTPVSLQGIISSIFNGKLHNSVDLSADGTFAKSWIRDKDSLYLLKADESPTSDTTIREIWASELLGLIGANHVEYSISYYDDTRVSKCRCFTSPSISYIPFRSLKYKYPKAIDKVRKEFPIEYANMAVATYLIGNEDLHDKNWGLLLDNSTLNFIGIAPLFDFNYAFTPKYNISGKLMWIPESKLIDMETGLEVLEDSFDIDSRIISTETLESVALREIGNCTLFLDIEDSLGKYPLEIREEIIRRLNLLKKELVR